MDARIECVLEHLIEDYIAHAEPISSQGLVRNHKLDVSSATVRNWFALLEQEGHLIQPHTSAGRIPSEKAYRWYVDRYFDSIKPSSLDREILKKIADAESEEIVRIKAIAKACVPLTGLATLVGTRSADTYYTGLTELFSQAEFADWSRVISMSSMLDRLDHQLNQLRSQSFEEPRVLLGDECPFGNACGAVLLTVSDDALMIILGPLRMNYKKALSVLRGVKTIL